MRGVVVDVDRTDVEAGAYFARPVKLSGMTRLTKNPQCYGMAHGNLGVVLVSSGRVPEAIEQHWERRYASIRILSIVRYYDLGAAPSGRGRPQEAIGEYEEALRTGRMYVKAQNNLGMALARCRPAGFKALGHYEEALQNPSPGFIRERPK